MQAVTRNLVQFVVGLVLGVYVVIMHDAPDPPISIPPIEELPDWLSHLFGSHNHR